MEEQSSGVQPGLAWAPGMQLCRAPQAKGQSAKTEFALLDALAALLDPSLNPLLDPLAALSNPLLHPPLDPLAALLDPPLDALAALCSPHFPKGISAPAGSDDGKCGGRHSSGGSGLTRG